MGQYAEGDIGDSASRVDYDNHSMMDNSVENVQQPGGPMPV